jgi:putative hemolysin
MVVVILLVLIVVNAVFVLAEMAIVSSRKPRLQQWANEGNRGAAVALELSIHPDRFLSTSQIGITLIGILTGAYGERALTARVSAALQVYPRIAPYSESIAFGIVVVAITYFSLVIGELVPKRLALLNPERFAGFFAPPLSFVSRIASPVVHLLGSSTRFILRVIGARPPEEPPVTEEEIKVMLEQGTEAGVFEEAEHDMMKSLLKLGDRTVDALMKPRREVVWLNLEDTWEDNRKKMATSLYSRFPVAQGTLDNVIGIVQAKDLLTRCLAGEKIDLKQAARPPLFVPGGLTALKLLEMFKKSRTHNALVVDEYGGVEGLVTLNDVMEDIVGDVASADMPTEKLAVQRADGSWLLDGKILIDDMKDTLGIAHLPDEDSGSYNTLGGFVMMQVGRVPVTGDGFDAEGHRFEVVDMDEKRVDKVLVSRVPPKEAETPKEAQ